MRQKWFFHNKIQFCLTKVNFVEIFIGSVCKLHLRNLNQTNLNTKMNCLIGFEYKKCFLFTKMNFVYKSDFCLQKWVLSWQNLFLCTKVNFVFRIGFCHDKSNFCQLIIIRYHFCCTKPTFVHTKVYFVYKIVCVPHGAPYTEPKKSSNLLARWSSGNKEK